MGYVGQREHQRLQMNVNVAALHFKLPDITRFGLDLLIYRFPPLFRCHAHLLAQRFQFSI